jgi:DNA (cytosine-5)-methyltransferase 1
VVRVRPFAKASRPVRELSLFTGAGGGLLGTRLLGWRHVGYVEWNDYCQRVIAQRIADGFLPRAPIFTDVREFAQSGAAEQYRGIADVVSAGFPCQPFSVAGKQLADADERNMWPATADVIRCVQPASVLLENVRGLVSCGYLGTVIGDLADLGYVGRWGVISAADCGAPHRRERLWIVAHAAGEQRHGGEHHSRVGVGGIAPTEPRNHRGTPNLADPDGVRLARIGGRGEERIAERGSQYVADTDSARLPNLQGGGTNEELERNGTAGRGGWWDADPADGPEPRMGRMADGVARRVDRLKATGNGQVPAVVARAWRTLA